MDQKGVPPAFQPQAAQPMIVPNMTAMPPADPPMGSGTWSNGLFDCFEECATCVVSWILPCCTVADNKNRLDGTSRCLAGWIHCCLLWNGCDSCYAAGIRGGIRKKSGIEGNFCEDCLLHFFCSSCALTQEKRQIDQLTKVGVLKQTQPPML